MKTPKEIFTEAFALVRDERTWTTGTQARNRMGREVRPRSPEAVCWCSVGAINRFWNSENTDERYAVIIALESEVDAIAKFNDTHTHAEVVAAWERAGKAKGWL